MTKPGSTKRKISIFGDSISTYIGLIPDGNRLFYDNDMIQASGLTGPEDTWWAQVINKLDATLCVDAAFSGGMVEGAGFPAGCDTTRATQITNSDTADSVQPDDVLIFLGINDYGWGGADAQAAGRSKSIPTCLDLDTIPEAVAQTAPDDAVEKFAAAYFEMLQQLHTAAPEATFHCITLLPAYVRDQPDLQFCYQLRGITLDTYNDAIRAAVKLACDSGINARVADIYALHRAYESIDGTHPTRKGMRQLANMALVAMNKITVSAVNKENEIGRQAFRTCFKPTCIGCKFARDTGNTWSCVCEHGVQK